MNIDRFRSWLPKSVEALSTYTRKDFAADLTAGLTVGLVALPLAMAFGISSGISSGVTPQAGIYTAVIAGFLISALGGSRTQIGGPTGAFVVVIAAIIARHGLSGLLMVTMMAGLILLFLGITGLGNAVKFIPRPVIIGFTNGIAVLIASTQIHPPPRDRRPQHPPQHHLRPEAGGNHQRRVRRRGGGSRQRADRGTGIGLSFYRN